MNITVLPRPLSVLVVEDESLVAMNLESILLDLGHTVIGPISSLSELDTVLETGLQADAAILDINIDGEEIYPHARRLHALGIPFLFASGYGASGISEDFVGCTVVPKPYTDRDIAVGLLDIQGRSGNSALTPDGSKTGRTAGSVPARPSA